MPRYLSTEQVDRLIAACDGDAGARRRDRAIVLLLARLGLRAGDVAQLRLTDIEWQTGSLRVCGKSRYEVRLPLPQDAGMRSPPTSNAGRLPAGAISCSCVRSRRAPFRRGDGISSVVKRIMKRADIVAPVKGGHALRHTAATEMLRHGVPFDKFGLVLRHRRHRHDGLLRKGRRRAAEAGCSALAGGALMLDAIETYLALRRATGFAMSTAEYLLKSFAAFAAERGQTYVETKKQRSTGSRSDHPSRNAMHGSEPSVASYATSGWRTSGTSCRRQITSAPARSVARRTSTRQTR
ncbi:hypothetical protein ABIB85_008479 [Bradyrhizobium sp. JR1.5]|uniref:tyrosine-type recombinase/integrase n=1 Tax=unclassified Bradyrhizobium TaxID=2631580 RepID=UPI003399F363